MRSILVVWALVGLLNRSVGAGDEALVVNWSFDDAQSPRVRDVSGNGNHGKIHGALFVDSPRGHALQFDGIDDFVACQVVSGVEAIQRAGTVEFWFKPQTFQGGLVNWSTGADWLDQRLVIAFKNYHGETTWIQASSNARHYRERTLDLPQKNVWNHVAVTFDGSAVAYYLDGVVRQVFCQDARPQIRDVPLWIGRSSGLGGSYFQGLIDELSVYGRPLSSLEVVSHYKRQAAQFGKETKSFQRPLITARAIPEPGWIAVEVDFDRMRPLPESSTVSVGVRDADGRRPLEETIEKISPHVRSVIAKIDATGLPPGTYQLVATILDRRGKPLGEPSQCGADWPGQPDAFKGIRILNNLVWEFLDLEPVGVTGERSYAFTSPKSRWIHLAADVDARGGSVTLSVEPGPGTRDMLVFEAGGQASQEAMRFLPAGRHRLVIRSAGDGRIRRLVLRSMPETMLHEFIFRPALGELGMSAEQFCEKYVLPNVNSFVVAPDHLDHPFFRKWQPSGRRWLTGLVVPRARGQDHIREPKDAVQYISAATGFSSPLVNGSIADEFLTSEPHCALYADAVRALRAAPGFEDRMFYVYANELYDAAEGRELVQALVETGAAIAWKHYLPTVGRESVARQYLRQEVVETARKYRELCPDSIEHLAVCPGNFSLVGGHLLNATPAVNHKVYLDMQYNLIANHPVFWGTYGLMSYHSGYADEETVRWTSRLFRHYGIEGSTELATTDPYESPHLANGDFAEGLRGWKIVPAEENSIRSVLKYGVSELQTRYQNSEGDTAVVTTRSANRPNTLTRRIENLRPGRRYVFRMMTGDYQDMSNAEKHAVAVKLENATVIPGRSFTHLFPNPPWHKAPPYDGEANQAWMNYHWVLFRADGETARVTITDWTDEREPGGPIGQQLMLNYLQVHPYYPR
ncbi:MAG: hypothetical protein CMJ59_18485 [Planctomycetaceae bacterium]|nr:hypothetical protein [Planctomycetaceae bacterium]